MQSFDTFLQQQWQLHERCVHAEYRLDWRKVQNCKKALQAFVVHCEDHHPNHLMAFCPQFYFASVSLYLDGPVSVSRAEHRCRVSEGLGLSTDSQAYSKQVPVGR